MDNLLQSNGLRVFQHVIQSNSFSAPVSSIQLHITLRNKFHSLDLCKVNVCLNSYSKITVFFPRESKSFNSYCVSHLLISPKMGSNTQFHCFPVISPLWWDQMQDLAFSGNVLSQLFNSSSSIFIKSFFISPHFLLWWVVSSHIWGHWPHRGLACSRPSAFHDVLA